MKSFIWIVVIVVVVLGLFGLVYVVCEDQIVMVLNLGKVVCLDIKLGLYFKVLVVEMVKVFDCCFQVFDIVFVCYFIVEQKDVSVDFFVIGYIFNVGDYFCVIGGDLCVVNVCLVLIIIDLLCNQINLCILQQLVFGDCSELIVEQLKGINEVVVGFGMQMIDLCIKQVDLLIDSQVINDVYECMCVQCKQEVVKLCVEGEEQLLIICVQVDCDSIVLIVEVECDVQCLCGEGDVEVVCIYGKVGLVDLLFYVFYCSLEVYCGFMIDGNGVIVFDKNDLFLQYLKNDC